MTLQTDLQLILFDGYCNLCSWSVQFIIKRDKNKNFIFMPVQSEKVATIRKNYSIDLQKPKTLILIEGGKIFTKSEAVLRIFKKIGFPWNLLWVLIIIPGFIRDPVYSLIARKRFLWFGRRDSCFLPDNEKQAEMN